MIGKSSPSPSPETVERDGAAMPLMEHLRELRSRLLKSFLAVAVGTFIAWFLYDPPGRHQGIIDYLINPYCQATAQFHQDQGLASGCSLFLNSVIGPFMLQLQVSVVVGLILASPVWIYQFWRFITPGLHRNERRWTLAFLLTSIPLFLAGVTLAYFILPKGLGFLLGFTPDRVINLVEVDQYLRFMIRMMLVFGIGFLMPVVVVVLNMIGILPSATLRRTRNWTIIGIFVFAAVGTPSGDPISMSLVAIPMWGLYEIAVIICRINDRRRRASGLDFEDLDDDEASDISAPTALDDEDDFDDGDRDREHDDTDSDR